MPSDDEVVELMPREPSAGAEPSQKAQLADLLMRVAERRDKQAFEQLYRYFAPRLHSYMISIGTASDIADDLVQETLAEVWCKAALYRPDKAAVSTWMFAIGRNRRIDRIRKVRSFEVAQETQPAYEPVEQIDYGRQLDDLDLLVRIKQQLPQEQFQILQFSYIEGLSQSEISRRLDLPLGTVKSRLRLAFARIRREVSST